MAPSVGRESILSSEWVSFFGHFLSCVICEMKIQENRVQISQFSRIRRIIYIRLQFYSSDISYILQAADTSNNFVLGINFKPNTRRVQMLFDEYDCILCSFSFIANILCFERRQCDFFIDMWAVGTFNDVPDVVVFVT